MLKTLILSLTFIFLASFDINSEINKEHGLEQDILCAGGECFDIPGEDNYIWFCNVKCHPVPIQ